MKPGLFHILGIFLILHIGPIVAAQPATTGSAEVLPNQKTVPEPDHPKNGRPKTEPPKAEQPGAERSAGAAQMTDIHDIKPPVKPGFDPTILYYTLAGVLILAMAAAAFLFWKRRKRKTTEDVTERLFPDEAAYRLLDELRGKQDISGKEFYFRLSAIVRGYVQARFGIDAPEMTTEEFVPRIEDLGIERDLQLLLRNLCFSIDPVKFAAEPAEEKQMIEDLSFVRSFVKQTTPDKEVSEEKGFKDSRGQGAKGSKEVGH